MDPPWFNKHIKRHKNKSDGYQMLSNDDIFDKLPNISEITDDNSLVIIWCTNSTKHLASIEKWLENVGKGQGKIDIGFYIGLKQD